MNKTSTLIVDGVSVKVVKRGSKRLFEPAFSWEALDGSGAFGIAVSLDDVRASVRQWIARHKEEAGK